MRRAVRWAGIGCLALLACSEQPSTDAGDATENTGASETSDSETGGGDCVPLDPDAEPVVETLTLTAADGSQVAATLARPGDATCRPGLILVHQFNRDRQQWAAQWSGAEPSFVAAGYVVLAIDLRGHGESSPYEGALTDLLTAPDQAPLDVAAALAALVAEPAVDTDKLAIVGTSIGANLAIVGSHQHPELEVAVALSPRLDPVNQLAGSPASLDIDQLYCLAGELETDQTSTCLGLAEQGTGASEAWIFPGTSAHGVELVDDFPETIPTVIAWLDAVLAVEG